MTINTKDKISNTSECLSILLFLSHESRKLSFRVVLLFLNNVLKVLNINLNKKIPPADEKTNEGISKIP